jgi:hypothetical protein
MSDHASPGASSRPPPSSLSRCGRVDAAVSTSFADGKLVPTEVLGDVLDRPGPDPEAASSGAAGGLPERTLCAHRGTRDECRCSCRCNRRLTVATARPRESSQLSRLRSPSRDRSVPASRPSRNAVNARTKANRQVVGGWSCGCRPCPRIRQSSSRKTVVWRKSVSRIR